MTNNTDKDRTDTGDTSLHYPEETHSTGENQAGHSKTTNREYEKREHGHQNVKGVPVGNPLDQAESDAEANPQNSDNHTATDEDKTGD